jgi:hypothetical protein
MGLWAVESAETCLVGAGLTQFRPAGKSLTRQKLEIWRGQGLFLTSLEYTRRSVRPWDHETGIRMDESINVPETVQYL